MKHIDISGCQEVINLVSDIKDVRNKFDEQMGFIIKAKENLNETIKSKLGEIEKILIRENIIKKSDDTNLGINEHWQVIDFGKGFGEPVIEVNKK